MSSYYPAEAAAAMASNHQWSEYNHHHYYGYFNQFQGNQQPQPPGGQQPPQQPQNQPPSDYSEKNEASKSPEQPPAASYEAGTAASDLARRMNCVNFNSEAAVAAEAAALQAASLAASYDMYAGQHHPKMTSGAGGANGNSFYPWMKNYNGRSLS